MEEEEEEVPQEIRIYPNPSLNKALTIQMKEMGSYTVRIFDSFGRLVDHFSFEGKEYIFSNNNMVNGIYILEIQSDEEVLFKSKFVIQ